MPAKIPISDFRKQRLMDWLCTIKADRDPQKLEDLAEELGATVATLRRWRDDPEFLAAWETQYRKTVGSPERKQEVIDALFDTARDRTDPRHVPAAKQFLEAVDAIKPQKMEVTVTKGAAKELTDDQLLSLVAERAARELEERSA